MPADGSPMDLFEALVVDRESAVTIESQIGRQLAHLIASDAIRIGDRLPPIRVMAQRLGINLHTVRASYDRLAEAGLVEMTRGRGTTVIGRSLAGLSRGRGQPRSFSVGVILPSLDAFYAPVVEGMQAAAEGDPSKLVVGFADERVDSAESLLRQFVTGGVDGVIVVSQKFGPLDLDAAGLPPIVFADWPGSPDPAIVFDPAPIGDLVDHLHFHGFRSFVFVSPPTHHPNIRPLLRSFQSAVDHHEAVATVKQVGGWGPADGNTAVRGLLAETDAPIAIVCATDQLAAGAIRAAVDQARVFGEDVAVTGWGGIEYTEFLEPALTTVRLPAWEMGHRAFSSLLDLGAGRAVPRVVSLVGSVLVRSSCGCRREEG